MLTQRQRISIRRHLGVPFAGTAQAGRIFGWRWAIHVEDLEYKMSNMAPSEEQLISGLSMASWRIMDSPSVGDVLTFTVTDTNGTHTVNYTVTAQDLDPKANIVNPSEAAPTFSIALHASTALNSALNSLGYTTAGVMPADLFSPQYLPPYFAELYITAPGSNTNWSIGASVTGTTNFAVQDQVYPSPVNAALFSGSTTYYGYVSILDALAMGMTQADLSLSYAKADQQRGVDFRPDEVAARKKLYRTYCELLSRDIGGQKYVQQFFGAGGGGGVA